MDQRLVAHLKSYAAAAAAEDKPEPHDINYHKIHQYSEQLSIYAKQATQTSYVGLEEMDRLCQLGEVLQKELYHVRSDLIRRKNLELLLPSPNTQHHLPCSSLLSPNSSTPSSPTGQQSMAMSTGASTSAGLVSPSTPNGSPTSPHSMNALSVSDTSMAIPSTGVMQSDDYWRSRKIDPSKMVRRSPTPLYVNLTEQMILAQSSKRKRPAEGDLYCHNCKTKDTPEWRRGPMGAKTLCNACGIRWRLSQAEAAKQKKGDQSPTQTIQYPPHISQLPNQSPTQPQQPQPPTQPMSVQQNLLQQQQQQQQQQQMQRQLQQQQQILQQHQQQMQQQLQQQYNQSQHQHQHPQQQHMVLPGHVGLAQENIPQNTRMSISGETAPRSGSSSSTVISSLSMTPSPIAT